MTISTAPSQTWNSDFTFVGPSNLNLGAGGVTMSNSATVTVSAGTLTVGGTVSDGGYGYNLVKVGTGTLALSGAGSSFNNLNVEAGVFSLDNSYSANPSLTVNYVEAQNAAINVTNAILNVNGQIRLGHDGPWSLFTVTSGTINQANSTLQLGYNDGISLVTLTGNTVYNGTGTQLQMGPAWQCNAQFVVKGNAVANFADIDIGDSNFVNGSYNANLVTVSGNGLLTGTQMEVGNQVGNGGAVYSQFLQTGGTTNISGEITLANNLNSSGGTLTGVVNLAGGVFKATSVAGGTNGGVSVFNFHGGTLGYNGATATGQLLQPGFQRDRIYL